MTRTASALSALVALLALAGCRGMTSSRPPIHLNPNMDEQRRLDPQERTALFPDGRAMRPQVTGTVPVATGPQDEAFLTGRVGGTPSTRLPADVPLDRALLERGRDRYGIYCAPCHDAAGTGAGTVPSRSPKDKPWVPPSFHDDRLRALALGDLYDVITHGVRSMPPYAAQIPPHDRWAIAAYVRVLQRAHDAPLAQVPPDVVAEKGWTP